MRLLVFGAAILFIPLAIGQAGSPAADGTTLHLRWDTSGPRSNLTFTFLVTLDAALLHPVPDANVTVQNGSGRVASGLTSPNGTVALGSFPPGEYRVSAVKTGYQNESASFVIYSEPELSIRFATVGALAIANQPLTFIVDHPDGGPTHNVCSGGLANMSCFPVSTCDCAYSSSVEGAAVTVSSRNRTIARGTSDANGTFTLAGLPEGSYLVTAKRDGYQSGSFSFNISLDAGQSTAKVDGGTGVQRRSVPTQLAFAGVAAGIGVAALVVVGARRQWPLLTAGLYARFAPSRLLEHPARQKLRALVEEQPGITVNDTERASGLTHGAFAHHLQKLEDGGLLLSSPDGQARRLFVPGAEPPLARAPMEQRILTIVAQRGALRPAAVARELGASRQAVHYHIKRLVTDGQLAMSAGKLCLGEVAV